MWFARFGGSNGIMRTFLPAQESCDVVPKGKTNSESEAGRLSLQGMRLRIEQKEEAVLAEEGEAIAATEWVAFFLSFARKSIF